MAQDFRIGCCGFPISLARYAGEFRVAEVQQTFYQPPLERTLQKWRIEVPKEFEFTLKAWQLITHGSSSPTYRRLREKLSEKQKRETGAFRLNSTVMTAWQRTLEAARILRSRVILFQCPARFGPTPENKSNLRAFFHEIRRKADTRGKAGKLTLVWEPRGEWKPEEVRELCKELGLVHGVDPFAQKPATKGLGYFRLHGLGGYRYRYTDEDLKRLLEKAMRRRSCYLLFNNIAMLEDARRFRKLVSACGGGLKAKPDYQASRKSAEALGKANVKGEAVPAGGTGKPFELSGTSRRLASHLGLDSSQHLFIRGKLELRQSK